MDASFTHPIERKPAHTVPLPTPTVTSQWIALDKIEPSPFNPRKAFDPGELQELADSIKARGLLENLVVRPHPKKKDHFELMGGERRYRALKLNKAEGANCNVIAADDGEALATQIVENMERRDLTPIEEAEAFAQLQKQDPKRWTAAEIGRTIGKTDSFVIQRMRLLKLAPKMRAAMEKGVLRIEAARIIASVPESLQKELAYSDWDFDMLTAEAVREDLAEHAMPTDRAAFDAKLYDGEFIEDGKKRWFADLDKFNTLQRGAAKVKLAELRKEWPTAKLVKSPDSYEWADNKESLRYSSDRKKATGKFSKDKATALVWIDRGGRLLTAEGVIKRQASSNAYSSYQSAARYEETTERKAVREAFNAKLTDAIAKDPDAAARLLLLEIIDSDSGINLSPKILKAALPTISIPNGYLQDKEKAKLWPQFKGLKQPALVKALGILGQAAIDEDSAWDEYHRDCPSFLLAVGKSLGVAPQPEEKPKAEDKKPDAKKTARAKAKSKKKA